jgi:hypothetical protein
MKITTTITREELTRTENGVSFDPCSEIKCGSLDCENCPLRKSAAAFNDARWEFLNTLRSLSVTED